MTHARPSRQVLPGGQQNSPGPPQRWQNVPIAPGPHTPSWQGVPDRQHHWVRPPHGRQLRAPVAKLSISHWSAPLQFWLLQQGWLRSPQVGMHLAPRHSSLGPQDHGAGAPRFRARRSGSPRARCGDRTSIWPPRTRCRFPISGTFRRHRTCHRFHMWTCPRQRIPHGGRSRRGPARTHRWACRSRHWCTTCRGHRSGSRSRPCPRRIRSHTPRWRSNSPRGPACNRRRRHPATDRSDRSVARRYPHTGSAPGRTHQCTDRCRCRQSRSDESPPSVPPSYTPGH